MLQAGVSDRQDIPVSPHSYNFILPQFPTVGLYWYPVSEMMMDVPKAFVLWGKSHCVLLLWHTITNYLTSCSLLGRCSFYSLMDSSREVELF